MTKGHYNINKDAARENLMKLMDEYMNLNMSPDERRIYSWRKNCLPKHLEHEDIKILARDGSVWHNFVRYFSIWINFDYEFSDEDEDENHE